MTTIKKYKIGERVLEILTDEYAENPRDEQDTVGTMWCWHGRYNLGSKKERMSKGVNPHDYSGWDELQEAIEKLYKPIEILPVYLYDHGGICLSTSDFGDPWDSGQVGFIFADREAVKYFGKKRLSKGLRETIRKALIEEIKEYSAYEEGNVYRWVLTENGEEIESCSGYYGYFLNAMLIDAVGAEAAKSAVEID